MIVPRQFMATIPSPHSFAFSRAPQGPQRHASVRPDYKLHRSQHHPNGLSSHSLGTCSAGDMVPFAEYIGLHNVRHDLRHDIHPCECVRFVVLLFHLNRVDILGRVRDASVPRPAT